MSVRSKLPLVITGLGYVAMGLALSVSWTQMQAVLTVQADLSGDYVRVALPAALLFGGTVLWRLAGHLYNRTQHRARSFGFAFALTLIGALFTESISIGTSAISLAMNINRAVQADIESKASYQSGEQLSAAASEAAARLQADLGNMPDNYRTESRRTTQALTELLKAQAQLAETQEQARKSTSATERTFQDVGARLGMEGDEVKYLWALALALGLSIIPLGVQFALGATSDGDNSEKSERDDYSMEPGENVSYLSPKKPQRRTPRSTSAKKRDTLKQRDPLQDGATVNKSESVEYDPVINESVQALISLGFKKGEATRRVEGATGESVEVRVRNALRDSAPKAERRRTLDQIAREIRKDIESGKLRSISNRSLAPYSTSKATRQKVIDLLVQDGLLAKTSTGRVLISAA